MKIATKQDAIRNELKDIESFINLCVYSSWSEIWGQYFWQYKTVDGWSDQFGDEQKCKAEARAYYLSPAEDGK